MKLKKIAAALLLVSPASLAPLSWADVSTGLAAYYDNDLDKSYGELIPSVQNDDATATFLMGMLFMDPTFSQTSLDKAEEWLKKAADLGSAEAAYNLAYFYLNNALPNSTQKNYQKYLEKAQSLNFIDAFLLPVLTGETYEQRFGQPDDIFLFKSLAKAHQLQPTPFTQLGIGSFLLMGGQYNDVDLTQYGIKIQRSNAEDGVMYLEQALDAGLLLALLPLSSAYKGEIEGYPANPDQSKIIEEKLEQQFFQIMADMVELKNIQPISIYSMQSDEARQAMINKLHTESKINASAALRLGNLYLSGAVTGKQNIEQAQYYYFQAVSLGEYSVLKKIYDEARYDSDIQRKMVPLIEQAVAESDPYGLYLMGLIYINGIQSDYDYDHNLALMYMQKAIAQGSLDALKALAYERANNLVVQDEEQLKYARQLIQLVPNDEKAYLVAARILMRNDINGAYDEIYGYVQKIEEIDANHPEPLGIIADFYGAKGKYQDGTKAIEYYDRLTELQANDLYSTEYRFAKAVLLKNGAENLAKNEKLALEILLSLTSDYVDREFYNVLGEMYQYGQGTEVNIPKAIENYKKGTRKILIPLGKLLLASQDIEQRNDGAYYIIEAMNDDGVQQEYETLLLKNLDLDFVQQWLLNIYRGKNIVKGQNAYQLIKKGYQEGIPRMQLNYAQILSSGNDDMKQQGQAILDQLMAQDYIPALRVELSNFSFTEPEKQLPLAQKIAEITKDDEDLQKLAEIYNRLERYDLAMATIEKIKDQERSFLSFRKSDAEKGLNQIQQLNEQVKQKDAVAMYELAKIAAKQDQQQERIMWLKRAMENGSAEAMQDFGMILIQKGDEENLTKGRQLLLKSIRAGNTEALTDLYQLYALDLDPRITRKEMSDLIFTLKYEGITAAGKYFEPFVYFDMDEKSLMTEEKGSKAYVSSLKNIMNMYKNGEGTKKNTEKYVQTLKELSEYDEGDAAYALGKYYEYLSPNEANIQEAVRWYQKANEQNYSNAGSRIIEWYDLLEKAKSGDLDAKLALIEYPSLDENPLSIDAQLQALVQQNHNGARVILAEKLLKQPKYEGNYQQALALLKEATDNGNVKAPTILAETLMYYQYDPKVEDVDAEIQAVLQKHPIDDNNKLLVNYFIQKKDFERAYAVIEQLPESSQFRFYQKLYDIFTLASNDMNYQAALKAAEKIVVLNPIEGNYRIGMLYWQGDQTLKANREKALGLLKVSFNSMLEEEIETSYSFSPDFSHISLKFQDVAEVLLLGNQEEQVLGLSWLLILAQYDQEDPAKAVMTYYKQQGDYANAYLYGLAYGFWEASDFESRLSEAQLNETKANAETLKKSFQYIRYIGEIKRWEKQAKEGSARALLRLGEIYQAGDMAAKNIELAIQYYEQAGKQGESFAYNRLGNLYRKGNGVAVDSAKAVEYFDLGAQTGDSNCAHQAGDVLYFGENDIDKDFVKAVKYFDMTDLSQGKHHALAKYKLAYIYYYGLGKMPQDKKRAYEILKQYESTGNEDIMNALKTWDFN